MLRIVFFCFFLYSYNFLFSQEIILDSCVDIKDLDVKENFIDIKNNIYTTLKDGKTICKILQNNKYRKYKNDIMGEIETLLVLNPSRVIIFYKKSNAIEILDSSLNLISYQSFNKLGFKIDKISGSEYDNIWLYLNNENKLIYYNFNKKEIIFQTKSLLEIFGRPFVPKKIISSVNRIWLIDRIGIIEINNFSHISNIYRYKNIDYIFPLDNYIGFVEKNKIIIKNDGEVLELKNPFFNYKNIVFYEQNIFVIYSEKVEFYKILLP